MFYVTFDEMLLLSYGIDGLASFGQNNCPSKFSNNISKTDVHNITITIIRTWH